MSEQQEQQGSGAEPVAEPSAPATAPAAPPTSTAGDQSSAAGASQAAAATVQGGEKPSAERSSGGRPPREARGDRPAGAGDAARDRGPRRDRPGRDNRGEGGPPREGRPGDRGPREGREGRRDEGRRDDRNRPGGRFEGPPEIDLEKLISDPLYLDNQAHAVVSRMRDMDSGTRSQLRRFYNAVRRACRTAEAERQHEFVMLRARLAYTIARHSLRSLDALERLLLQVTRRNDARGYERFRDLFEAIVAYNE